MFPLIAKPGRNPRHWYGHRSARKHGEAFILITTGPVRKVNEAFRVVAHEGWPYVLALLHVIGVELDRAVHNGVHVVELHEFIPWIHMIRGTDLGGHSVVLSVR